MTATGGLRPPRTPPTLRGKRVTLRPMTHADASHLVRWASDPLVPIPRDVAELERWIGAALEEQILGKAVAFLTRRVSDGAPIGSTRFLHIDRANKTAEIGWTFLGRDARRTVANTEAKYLQLRHLFEDLGAHRVWLQTDKLNERSQRALERLGAIKEGEHRDDRISHDGRIRTSVVYGITRSDWPWVGQRIRGLLAR